MVKASLHWTIRKAAVEFTVLTLLLAKHLYSPLSVLFTVVIVSCLLYAEKVILGLEVVFTGDPFMVQENVGVGLPLALHKNDTFKPSSTIWFCGCSDISGWSVLRGKVLIC